MCKKLLVGLDVVLNPDEKGRDSSGTGFASALDEVCKNGTKATEDGWLEVLGELIGRGIDATSSAWGKQYQAQQSGLKLFNRNIK